MSDNMRLKSILSVAICLIASALLLLTITPNAFAAAPEGYISGVGHSILASPDGDLSNYVMTLRIYNISGTSGSNTLYVGTSQTQADWDDIYICDSGNTKRYPHWIDWSNSGPNYVLVYYNVTDGIPTQGKQINVYYNNPSASNAENPYAVFSLYDNFDGPSINNTIWSDFTAGTGTITNGVITITSSDSNNHLIRSIAGFSANYSITAKIKTLHSSSNTHTEFIRWNGDQGAFYSWSVFPGVYYQGSGTGALQTQTPIIGWSANAYHIQDIIRDGKNNKGIFSIDGSNTVTLTTNFPTDIATIDILASLNGASISCDYIIVKRYTPNAPQDGTWGNTYGDTQQAVKFNLIRYDLLNLCVGGCPYVSVRVLDANNNQIDSGITGNDGSATFILYRGQKITLIYENVTMGISKTVTLYPSGLEYDISIFPWESSWTPGKTGEDSEMQKVVTYTVIAMNGDNGEVTAYYNDTTGSTSTVTMKVYKRLNMTAETQIDTYTQASSNFNHKFTIAGAAGTDYKVVITATSSYYGTVVRTYSWTFPGQRYAIPGLPEMAYVWIGFLLPLMVTLAVSYRNLKFGPIVFCALEWGFVSLGWMSQLGAAYPLILTVVTVFSIFLIFNIKIREGQ